ncbi:unnamed protein product [Phytomonas sp. EM1]|nr:unnamed protein product [Phytomonas sp. EM1]|eukprot:CCW65583.1 unnamed protein product [Phytomonas sp. isolate EM1]
MLPCIADKVPVDAISVFAPAPPPMDGYPLKDSQETVTPFSRNLDKSATQEGPSCTDITPSCDFISPHKPNISKIGINNIRNNNRASILDKLEPLTTSIGPQRLTEAETGLPPAPSSLSKASFCSSFAIPASSEQELKNRALGENTASHLVRRESLANGFLPPINTEHVMKPTEVPDVALKDTTLPSTRGLRDGDDNQLPSAGVKIPVKRSGLESPSCPVFSAIEVVRPKRRKGKRCSSKMPKHYLRYDLTPEENILSSDKKEIQRDTQLPNLLDTSSREDPGADEHRANPAPPTEPAEEVLLAIKDDHTAAISPCKDKIHCEDGIHCEDPPERRESPPTGFPMLEGNPTIPCASDPIHHTNPVSSEETSKTPPLSAETTSESHPSAIVEQNPAPFSLSESASTVVLTPLRPYSPAKGVEEFRKVVAAEEGGAVIPLHATYPTSGDPSKAFRRPHSAQPSREMGEDSKRSLPTGGLEEKTADLLPTQGSLWSSLPEMHLGVRETPAVEDPSRADGEGKGPHGIFLVEPLPRLLLRGALGEGTPLGGIAKVESAANGDSPEGGFREEKEKEGESQPCRSPSKGTRGRSTDSPATPSPQIPLSLPLPPCAGAELTVVVSPTIESICDRGYDGIATPPLEMSISDNLLVESPVHAMGYSPIWGGHDKAAISLPLVDIFPTVREPFREGRGGAGVAVGDPSRSTEMWPSGGVMWDCPEAHAGEPGKGADSPLNDVEKGSDKLPPIFKPSRLFEAAQGGVANRETDVPAENLYRRNSDDFAFSDADSCSLVLKGFHPPCFEARRGSRVCNRVTFLLFSDDSLSKNEDNNGVGRGAAEKSIPYLNQSSALSYTEAQEPDESSKEVPIPRIAFLPYPSSLAPQFHRPCENARDPSFALKATSPHGSSRENSLPFVFDTNGDVIGCDLNRNVQSGSAELNREAAPRILIKSSYQTPKSERSYTPLNINFEHQGRHQVHNDRIGDALHDEDNSDRDENNMWSYDAYHESPIRDSKKDDSDFFERFAFPRNGS